MQVWQLCDTDVWLCVCTVRLGLGYVRAVVVYLPSGQSVLCNATALDSPASLPGFISVAFSRAGGRSTRLIVLARQTQPDSAIFSIFSNLQQTGINQKNQNNANKKKKHATCRPPYHTPLPLQKN